MFNIKNVFVKNENQICDGAMYHEDSAAPQEFVPMNEGFGTLDVWETKDPYIQLAMEYGGGTAVVDRGVITLAGVDDEYVILVSSKFFDLSEKDRVILLNKAYMQYAYMYKLAETKNELYCGCLKAENNTVLFTSKDVDLRINSNLYAAYGKAAVERANKHALLEKPMTKIALIEYKEMQKFKRQLSKEMMIFKVMGMFTPPTSEEDSAVLV